MKSKYKTFIEAFLLTIVVFIIGLYLGIVLEDNRVTIINEYQIQSEVSLLDITNLNNLVGYSRVSCDELKKANFELFDRVYEEAQTLERYETKERLASKLQSLHKKYDALRVSLWVNSMKIKDECDDNFNTIVYLYNYSEEDLTKQAEQNVWSKVLEGVKSEKGDEVLLIPFAVDTSLASLNAMLGEFNVTRYPVVIINEKEVLTELRTKEEVISLLD